MKKTTSALIILLLFLVPALGNASYIIHLKNGGQFSTPRYWEEDNYVKFYIVGGMMGIEKNFVRKIERSTLNLDGIYKVKTPAIRPAEAEQKAEESLSPQQPAEKIDLKAYQDKMATLKADINKTLTRIRKADTSKDLNAKDEATADNRRISAQMWKLTDELKEKNKGKLPDDWWEGVGREEPATP